MNLIGLYRNFVISSFIALCLIFPKNSLAASASLSSNQSQIGQGDEYTVTINLSVNVANGTNYFLRGTFYQTGTTNYCGYTYNGTDWYNGPYTTNSGWLKLFPITIGNSSWSGTLKAKLDTQDPGCNGSGTYNFKIERFTNSGNGTFDSQNEQSITVVIPTATLTPAPTSTPTPPPATNTSFPTSIPTTRSSATSTIKPSSIVATIPISLPINPTITSASSEVLGSSISATPTTITKKEKMKSQQNYSAILFFASGTLLLTTCGILVYRKWKKRNLDESTNE